MCASRRAGRFVWQTMSRPTLIPGLTRKHGIKIASATHCSVEQCGLAVGEVVGYNSVKSAARMNSAVVIFVDSVDKVNTLVERGVVINGSFVSVSPLSTPSKRVTISNVPPFINDADLARELSRFGNIISPIKKLPSGCKSPLLKHVVSHRRQVLMILNKADEDINLVFSVRVDDFNYTVYANSGTLKCFKCGVEGHLARACPERDADASFADASASRGEEEGAAGGEQRQDDVSEQTVHTQAVSEQTVQTVSEQTVQVPLPVPKARARTIATVHVQPAPVTMDIEQAPDTEQAMGSGEQERQKNSEQAQSTAGVSQNGSVVVNSDESVQVDKTAEVNSLKRKGRDGSGKGSQAKKGMNSVSITQKEKQVESSTGVEVEGEEEEEEEERGEEEEENGDEEWGDCDDTDLSQCSFSSQPMFGPQSVKPPREKHYDIKQIQRFLQTTKNMKNVEVGDHFADEKLFLKSVRSQMKDKSEDGYTSQEVYRLRKMVQKLNSKLNGGTNAKNV